MKAESTVDAILLTNEHKSFTTKGNDGQNELVEYYEAKFLISNDLNQAEVLTLRGKDIEIDAEPFYEDVVSGKFQGKLTFDWQFDNRTKGYKPKFIKFEF